MPGFSEARGSYIIICTFLAWLYGRKKEYLYSRLEFLSKIFFIGIIQNWERKSFKTLFYLTLISAWLVEEKMERHLNNSREQLTKIMNALFSSLSGENWDVH